MTGGESKQLQQLFWLHHLRLFWIASQIHLLGLCALAVYVMAASASQEGLQVIRSLAAASHALDRDQLRQVQRLHEVCKEAHKGIYEHKVALSDHTPTLQSCSGDCTPIQVSEQVTLSLQQGHTETSWQVQP